jgi:hypothetical protein
MDPTQKQEHSIATTGAARRVTGGRPEKLEMRQDSLNL